MKQKISTIVTVITSLAILVTSHMSDPASSMQENTLYTPINPSILGDNFVYTPVAKLVASDFEDEDAFGYSIDVSEDYLVVGNPFDDDIGTRSGAAYIFERTNAGEGNWIETKKLTPFPGTDWEYFGGSVAVYGSTVVVGAGAGGSMKGEAYVYERDFGGPGNWGLVKALSPDTLSESAAFGRGVDIYGDTIIVGAFSNSTQCEYCGSVFIYERDLGGMNNWGLLKELVAFDSQPWDFFGIHVSLYEDTLLISSENRDVDGIGDNLGAVFVYYRNFGGVNNWGYIKIIQPLMTVRAHDKSMRVNGNMAIIGTVDDQVKIFQKDYGGLDNWGLLTTLYGSESFGTGVDLLDKTAIVGILKDPDNGYQAGAAKIFTAMNQEMDFWLEAEKILAYDGNISDAFGISVLITDDQLFIAAYQEDNDGIQAGAVYVYHYRYVPLLYLPLISH